jgi:hypothetical protein
MISADSGGNAKVIGKSIAMVAVGPRPGRTPTAVPRNTPMRQYKRLIGVAAVEKPRARLEKRSINV